MSSRIPESVPARLARLTHRRWAIPVLGALAEPGADRLAVLRSRLDAPRGSLIQAIDHLIGLGLIRRNPGHGHPLRPEYLIEKRAEPTAQASAALVRALAQKDPELLLRKWSLPVLAAVQAGAHRFGEVRGELPGATDRALAAALRDLVGEGLITRSVDDGAPPNVGYRLTRAARTLARRAHELGRTLR